MDGWVKWVGLVWMGGLEGAVAVPKENHIECWCGEGLRSGGMHMDGCACKEMHTQTRPCGISAVSLKQCRANSELSRSPDAIYGRRVRMPHMVPRRTNLLHYPPQTRSAWCPNAQSRTLAWVVHSIGVVWMRKRGLGWGGGGGWGRGTR